MVLPLAYAFCNVPLMPLRSDPTHRAEQVSQLLFGEKVEILEVNNKEWAKIICAWDGHEGWCKRSQLTTMPKKEYRKEIKYLAATHSDKLIMETGEMWLPLGSELIGLKAGKIKPVHEAGKFKGKKLNIKAATLSCETLKAAAFQYLHAPYQWGGRSIAGIDCSGLTQMTFKLCNRHIPRDASQQANEGQLVDFLQHAQCGDLAFFDDKDGKIVHVGILLDNQTIIHATDTSGRVVVDRIDQAGIISASLRLRTHNLRLVKRMF
ncbi:MAG: NlpC/P60 family protein [Chitinophagales bacterium]